MKYRIKHKRIKEEIDGIPFTDSMEMFVGRVYDFKRCTKADDGLTEEEEKSGNWYTPITDDAHLDGYLFHISWLEKVDRPIKCPHCKGLN